MIYKYKIVVEKHVLTACINKNGWLHEYSYYLQILLILIDTVSQSMSGPDSAGHPMFD